MGDSAGLDTMPWGPRSRTWQWDRAFVALAVSVALPPACDQRPGRSTAQPAVSNVDSGVPPTGTRKELPSPQASGGARRIGERISRFALELDRARLRTPAARDDEVAALSPASLFLALGLAHQAAAGNTRQELARVLYGDSGDENAGPFTAELIRFLSARPETILQIANAYWVAEGLDVEPEFATLARKHYFASGAALDFERDTPGATRRINAWVDQQTRHLIPSIVQEGSLAKDTTAVLTNAVYFFAPWAKPFDASNTSKSAFRELGGQTTQVPMMHQRLDAAHADTPFGTALLLPYGGDDLSLLVVLPRDERWFRKPLPEDFFDGIQRSVRVRSVDLSLPRFDVSGSIELGATLGEMGVATAVGKSANFGRMFKGSSAKLSAILHRARIRVDEKGTEGAAATAIGMVPVSPALGPVAFVVDRPFLYVIRSNATGAVLFLGRVGKLVARTTAEK